MAQAAMDFDFKTDKGFSFCLTPRNDERECDKWNTLATTKLKDVIASARKYFKWQSSRILGFTA